jgi:hypothetical protein
MSSRVSHLAIQRPSGVWFSICGLVVSILFVFCQFNVVSVATMCAQSYCVSHFRCNSILSFQSKILELYCSSVKFVQKVWTISKSFDDSVFLFSLLQGFCNCGLKKRNAALLRSVRLACEGFQRWIGMRRVSQRHGGRFRFV